MAIHRFICRILVLAPALALVPAAHAQEPCSFEWRTLGTAPNNGTNGQVYAMTRWGSLLVVGGTFTKAGGVPAEGVAYWDGQGWSGLPSQLNRTVHALTVFKGQLIAAGPYYVEAWNGQSWSYLNSTNPPSQPSGYVRALAVYTNPQTGQEELIAGGSFVNTQDMVTVNNIARWDGTRWSAVGAGVNGEVKSLTVYRNPQSGQDELIAGGYFTSSGGLTTGTLARWDGSTWAGLGAWGTMWSGPPASIVALTSYHGSLIATGFFQSAGGIDFRYVARWDGSAWSALGPGLNGAPFSLSVYNDELIAAGGFSRTGDQQMVLNNIARWDETAWSPLGTGFNYYYVNALVEYEGQLIAGGELTAGGVPVLRVARWLPADGNTADTDSDGRLDVCDPCTDSDGDGYGDPGHPANTCPGDLCPAVSSLDEDDADGDGVANPCDNCPDQANLDQADDDLDGQGDACDICLSQTWLPLEHGVDGEVYAATTFHNPQTDQDELIVGGNFTSGSGVTAHGLIRWDGLSWSALPGWEPGTVNALAVYDGKLIVGGYFILPGTVPKINIASWDGATWSALGQGLNGPVHALALYNGELVAGGAFGASGGVQLSFIGRWNGVQWQPISSGPSGRIVALAAHDGDLFVGGEFPNIGQGTPANHIARWNGEAWSALAGGMDRPVYALAWHDGSLVAGGLFAAAGGSTAHAVARWDGTAWSAMGSGFNLPVRALAVHKGQLLAAGEFYTSGVQPLHRLARWTGTGWSPVGSGFASRVYCMAVYAHDLVAGGDFYTLWNGSVFFGRIARWGATQVDADADGVVDPCDRCPGTLAGLGVDAEGCPARVSGDSDRDGDVDFRDLGAFESCGSGPAIPKAGSCDGFDFDGDADVDQGDFGVFQRCWSGHDVPADPMCAG